MDDVFERFGMDDISSGYSVSVKQTPEGPKVCAKVGKDTNVAELRRQLQQQYPSAQIEIEARIPLIRVISTRSDQLKKNKRTAARKAPKLEGQTTEKSIPVYCSQILWNMGGR